MRTPTPTRPTFQAVALAGRTMPFIPTLAELACFPQEAEGRALRAWALDAYAELRPDTADDAFWAAALERTALAVLRRLDKGTALAIDLVRAAGADNRAMLPLALALLVWGTEQVSTPRGGLSLENKIRSRVYSDLRLEKSTPSAEALVSPFSGARRALPVPPLDEHGDRALWAREAREVVSWAGGAVDVGDVLVACRSIVAYLRRRTLEGSPASSRGAVLKAVGKGRPGAEALVVLTRGGAVRIQNSGIVLGDNFFPGDLNRAGSRVWRQS